MQNIVMANTAKDLILPTVSHVGLFQTLTGLLEIVVNKFSTYHSTSHTNIYCGVNRYIKWLLA